MKRRWSEEEVEFLRENWGKKSGKEIATCLVRSEKSVFEKARFEGMAQRPYMRWTPEKLAYLGQYYGKTSAAILAAHLGCTEAAVLKKAEVIGLAKPHYAVNSQAFSTWDELSSYWAGFLLADGHVGKTRSSCFTVVSLGIKDRDHLARLKDFLQTEAPIKTFLHGKHAYAKLQISNKDISGRLLSLGLISHRGGMNVSLPKVPREYQRHFIRGLSDGDYCVGLYGTQLMWKLSGGERSLSDVLGVLVSTGGISTSARVRPGHRSFSVQLQGQPAIDALAWMYHGCHIYLPRKWQVFQRYIQLVKERKELPDRRCHIRTKIPKCEPAVRLE